MADSSQAGGQEDGDKGALRIGRYEILERIGVGGMAEVFRARAHGPGGYRRELIIKRILSHLAGDADFVRSFVDEAKLLGMINHQNVVGVYDFGLDQGRHYLALEYLDGPSVADIIARTSKAGVKIPAGVIGYIGREVCNGLSAVHTLRGGGGHPLEVIHRDVTPSNIMTTSTGAVKLLDFGIAKSIVSQNRTRHGHVKGKAGYFAPEQIKGGAIDARVDLFALGVVLHEALSLEPLFYGEGGVMGAIYRTMELVPPLPSSLRPDIPPALDAVVMKALERDPASRYASASEMASALAPLAASEHELVQFLAENQGRRS